MRISIAAAVLLSASFCFGQAGTTPASKPAAPAVTPEQREVINQYNKTPADQPMKKMVTKHITNDNAPNPAFGKDDAGFLKAHEYYLKRKEKPLDLLFIGDSITQGWGNNGKKVWAERYEKLNAANFGIGGDRTQHVLWRLENGELDGIKPKVVVLMIGTNNPNPADDLTRGVKACVAKIHEKLPETKVLLLGIFPRGEKPEKNTAREKLQAVNAELAKLDDGKKTRYLEIWKQFMNEDGSISKEIMYDYLHLTEKGYTIWADTMQPVLDEMMK